jgi:flagellar biogenesis protein FliO
MRPSGLIARGAALTGWASLAAVSRLLAATNLPPAVVPAPDWGASLFRLAGAFVLVVGVFLGGAWLFRNWQRVMTPRGMSPKLQILEVKSLGQRHALYVVGYEQQRLLLAASPTGVNLLTALPPASGPEAKPAAPGSFVEALRSAEGRAS